jgi:hypothetical protein
MRVQILAGLAAAIALAGCSDRAGPRPNAGMCFDFKAAKAQPSPGASAEAAALEDCVRRWAYSLAPSRDEAGAVAAAAAGACSAQLSRWNQQALAQPGAEGETASLLTGEPTTPLAEHNNYAHARALLYVVQARAGSCAPPPAKNGVPEGVS